MKLNKFLITTLLILLTSASVVFGQAGLDPTGTYEYKGKTTNINGQIFGPYTGTIQVKKIADTKIVMTFFVCKGEPSYNSGSFADTLTYINRASVYTTPDEDTTCKITFHFDKEGVTVKEETADYNWGCGFGHAVVADGRYKKTSSKIPKLTEPLTGEEIK